MLDKFDYAEPDCPICEGKDFYYPQSDAPRGRIPVARIIDKIDALFDKNDVAEAGRLLCYWRDEAIALGDKRGELSMVDELVGYYRKQNDRERGLDAISRALFLTKELSQTESASGATVFLNCATAYKAFGMADKAMPLYRRAEDVYKRVLAPDDARFGGLYNNMALALADLGEYGEAEDAYFAALAIMKNVPAGTLEMAITYINLAHMYEAAGRDGEIDDCMKHAYILLRDKALSKNGYYAFVLAKCAPSFGYFGNEDICRELLQLSEEIYEGT